MPAIASSRFCPRKEAAEPPAAIGKNSGCVNVLHRPDSMGESHSRRGTLSHREKSSLVNLLQFLYNWFINCFLDSTRSGCVPGTVDHVMQLDRRLMALAWIEFADGIEVVRSRVQADA